MKKDIDSFYYFTYNYAMRSFIGDSDKEIGYDYYNNFYKHMEDQDSKIKFVEILRSIKI